jgi:hypothetical protein
MQDKENCVSEQLNASGSGHFTGIHIEYIPALAIQVSKCTAIHPFLIGCRLTEKSASCSCCFSGQFIDFRSDFSINRTPPSFQLLYC